MGGGGNAKGGTGMMGRIFDPINLFGTYWNESDPYSNPYANMSADPAAGKWNTKTNPVMAPGQVDSFRSYLDGVINRNNQGMFTGATNAIQKNDQGMYNTGVAPVAADFWKIGQQLAIEAKAREEAANAAKAVPAPAAPTFSWSGFSLPLENIGGV